MCMSSSLLPLLCDPEGKAKDRTSSFICPHISSTVISHLMKMLGLTKLGKEKKNYKSFASDPFWNSANHK